MFQDFQLFPHKSVLESLIYAPMITGESESVYTKKATDLLNALGISEKANNFPNQLSGGQKQRTAFATSLLLNPDILL